MEDALKVVAKSLRIAARSMLTAAKHIPEDQREVTFGGVSKPARWIVAHCAKVHRMAAKVVQGQSLEDVHHEAMDTSADWETAVSELKESADDLVRIVEELSPDAAARKVRVPWGEEIAAIEFASFVAGHTMYHCGQLNYIQTLLGDGDMHFE